MEAVTVLLVIALVQIICVCIIYQCKTLGTLFYKFMMHEWEKDTDNKE